jgi:hypothetical protein
MNILELYPKNIEAIAKIKFDKVYTEEAKLTAKVKDYLDLFKPELHYWKASDRFKPGISDIILCFNGKFGAIELKDDTNTPTMHQLLFIQNIIMAGGNGAVCRTLRDVENFLKTL